MLFLKTMNICQLEHWLQVYLCLCTSFQEWKSEDRTSLQCIRPDSRVWIYNIKFTKFRQIRPEWSYCRVLKFDFRFRVHVTYGSMANSFSRQWRENSSYLSLGSGDWMWKSNFELRDEIYIVGLWGPLRGSTEAYSEQYSGYPRLEYRDIFSDRVGELR